MTSESPDRLVSIMEAADRLGMSRCQLVTLVEQGLIASRFEGWHRRVSFAELAAWRATHST